MSAREVVGYQAVVAALRSNLDLGRIISWQSMSYAQLIDVIDLSDRLGRVDLLTPARRALRRREADTRPGPDTWKPKASS